MDNLEEMDVRYESITLQSREDTMSENLEIVIIKQEITEVIYRYCRAYDRMDVDLALSVWHPGGTVAYGNTYDGLASDYLGQSWSNRAGLANISHQVTNILIRTDGESAVSESYVTASLQKQPENGVIKEDLYRGRYLDNWSRKGGRWAIDRRRFIPDSFTRIEFDADLADADLLNLSKMDSSDPSYEHFRLG